MLLLLFLFSSIYFCKIADEECTDFIQECRTNCTNPVINECYAYQETTTPLSFLNPVLEKYCFCTAEDIPISNATDCSSLADSFKYHTCSTHTTNSGDIKVFQQSFGSQNSSMLQTAFYASNGQRPANFSDLDFCLNEFYNGCSLHGDDCGTFYMSDFVCGHNSSFIAPQSFQLPIEEIFDCRCLQYSPTPGSRPPSDPNNGSQKRVGLPVYQIVLIVIGSVLGFGIVVAASRYFYLRRKGYMPV